MNIDDGIRRKRVLARIFGNFGVSFFGPLISSNVAETIFNVGLQFEETVIIAAIAAMFQTGYLLSVEMIRYGERKSVSST